MEDRPPPKAVRNPLRSDLTLLLYSGSVYCLGAPLARLEARTAFPVLVQAFPDMELASDDVKWTRSPLVRGPEELRLRV